MRFTGYDVADVIPLCTTNPARLLVLGTHYRKLEVGAPANLTLFHYLDGEKRFIVKTTVREGTEIFRRI